MIATQSLHVLLVEGPADLSSGLLELSLSPTCALARVRNMAEGLERLRTLCVDVVLVGVHALDPATLQDLAAVAPDAAIVGLYEACAGADGDEPALPGVHEWLASSCLRNGCGLGFGYVRRVLVRARDRKRADDQLAALALLDPLTGLPNRRAIEPMLVGALARARRHRRQVGVLFADLDRFKRINDRFGHAGGDLVLREVAARLRAGLRASDVVARLGGDEFVAVVEDLAEPAAAEAVVQKLQNLLAAPIQLGAQRVRCAASIGFVLGPSGPADTAERLLAAADAAMYRIKHSPAPAARPAQSRATGGELP